MSLVLYFLKGLCFLTIPADFGVTSRVITPSPDNQTRGFVFPLLPFT